MENIVNNLSSTLITIFQNVIQTYERNEETIERIEGELNDLNHEIELSEPKDMYKGYLLYKEIRELRIERRKCKDENKLLEDMYEFFKNSQTAEQFKNKIQKIQGNSVKVAKSIEQQTYTPKQRNDLTITNKHAEAHKPFEDLMKEFKKTKVRSVGGKLRK